MLTVDIDIRLSTFFKKMEIVAFFSLLEMSVYYFYIKYAENTMLYPLLRYYIFANIKSVLLLHQHRNYNIVISNARLI